MIYESFENHSLSYCYETVAFDVAVVVAAVVAVDESMAVVVASFVIAYAPYFDFVSAVPLITASVVEYVTVVKVEEYDFVALAEDSVLVYFEVCEIAKEVVACEIEEVAEAYDFAVTVVDFVWVYFGAYEIAEFVVVEEIAKYGVGASDVY